MYIGFLPFTPGTFGAAFGAVIIWLFPAFFGDVTNALLATIMVIFLSVITINLHEHVGKDPKYIIIDEVAGMFVTMAGHGITLTNIIFGFVLFRIFDIWKPIPVRTAERLPRGYGIVADDVLAGLYASFCLLLWEKLL